MPKTLSITMGNSSDTSGARALSTSLPSPVPLIDLQRALEALEAAVAEDTTELVTDALAPLMARVSALESRSRPSIGAGVPIRDAMVRHASKTPPRAPQPSKVVLPTRLTVKSLVGFLERNGFEVDNRRDEGGGIWVPSTVRFNPIVDALSEYGVQVVERDKRRRKTGKWFEIDTRKILE